MSASPTLALMRYYLPRGRGIDEIASWSYEEKLIYMDAMMYGDGGAKNA